MHWRRRGVHDVHGHVLHAGVQYVRWDVNR